MLSVKEASGDLEVVGDAHVECDFRVVSVFAFFSAFLNSPDNRGITWTGYIRVTLDKLHVVISMGLHRIYCGLFFYFLVLYCKFLLLLFYDYSIYRTNAGLSDAGLYPGGVKNDPPF